MPRKQHSSLALHWMVPNWQMVQIPGLIGQEFQRKSVSFLGPEDNITNASAVCHHSYRATILHCFYSPILSKNPAPHKQPHHESVSARELPHESAREALIGVSPCLRIFVPCSVGSAQTCGCFFVGANLSRPGWEGEGSRLGRGLRYLHSILPTSCPILPITNPCCHHHFTICSQAVWHITFCNGCKE